MEKSIETVLRAIIQAMVETDPSGTLQSNLSQKLYGAAEDMLTNGMPAEGRDVGRMADFVRDVRPR